MWVHLISVILFSIVAYLEWPRQRFLLAVDLDEKSKEKNASDPPQEWPDFKSLFDQYLREELVDENQHTSFKLLQKSPEDVLTNMTVRLMKMGVDMQDLSNTYRTHRMRCLKSNLKTISVRHPSNKRYNESLYNKAIRAISIDTFLSTALQFCRDAVSDERIEIISVGCGDGRIEREIMTAYRGCFGSEIKITLVDPAHEVDYKLVIELIEKRPEVVGHCVLFIIWPELPSRNDGYDIDAIRKLRPRALLIVYELTGLTGSSEFLNFLRNDTFELSREEYGMNNMMNDILFGLKNPRDKNNYGVVDDYVIEEVALEKLFCTPLIGTDLIRMVILKKK